MTKKIMNVPYREYFGFFQFVSTTVITLFIIIWSLFPIRLVYPEIVEFRSNVKFSIKIQFIQFCDEIIEILPQRYWIIVVQSLVLSTMLFIYLGMLLLNIDVLTVPLNDSRTLVDEKSSIIDCKTDQDFLSKYAFTETNGVLDLPISQVCRVLYGDTAK